MKAVMFERFLVTVFIMGVTKEAKHPRAHTRVRPSLPGLGIRVLHMSWGNI